MIKINDIASFRDPESYKVIPDDRIQKIAIIGGVVIQDYGHVENGDAISIVCMFSEANFNQLLTLWEDRETVTFTDTAGEVRDNLIIVMKEYERDKRFKKYITATFELWKNASPYG